MQLSSLYERLQPLLEPRETAAQGVRGFLNRYPVPIGAGVVFVVLCSLFLAHSPSPRSDSVQAYYTVDDGETFFPASDRVPPFSSWGKQAVGAMVYSCDGGKTRFVGYLYRYTPEGRARAEKMLKEHRVGPPFGMEVKRPGTGAWVAAVRRGPATPGSNDDGASITNVKCPDGGSPFIVNPP